MLDRLLVFVEEPSMEAALEHLLPRMLGEVPFDIYRFQCKDDLLLRLPERLRAYGTWLPDDWVILVAVDRDDDDCRVLKARLEQFALDARLMSRAQAGGERFQVVNRVVEEELEAWFFGDWEAVQAAYPRVSPTIPQKQKYRLPDRIAGGTWEAFEHILQKAGYFRGGLRKVEAAREIAVHMVPQRNCSTSFAAFQSAVDAALQR